MASPTVSTPSSAGSPAALAQAPPALAIKAINNPSMVTIAPASGLPTPTIVTTKEWVIPPRPKPGRKPATDTPPTKRKAQNRAAQRAFRERRAARVGELEEQLDEVREEQQRRETELREKVSRLEAEVLRFSGEIQSWKLRCDTLDRIVEYEKSEKESALAELAYLRNGSRSTGTDAVPLPPRKGKQGQISPLQEQYVSTQQAPPVTKEHLGCGNCTSSGSCACVEQAMEITTSGCGNCTSNGHCQCLEDVLKDVTAVTSPTTELKRPISPAVEDSPEKRPRQSIESPLEIDFTSQFSSKYAADPVRPPLESTAQITDRRPAESCGFCEEGTYCMCAEAATVRERDHQNRLAPLLNEVTPPPSDTDLDNTVTKLPSMQPRVMHKPVSAPTSCINGPGTCQQCQNDPKSGLFCRSLSALVSSGSSSTPEACCGGSSNGGGCCKSQNTSQSSNAPPTLSFADTYKTLSSHKNFDQASDELNTWLGRLHATAPQHPGRAPMEVEAASVMGVLKLFDRRFGRS
ncbi:hypothetical protein F5884DRAFT_462928 [Xylogone sp. PMI_703]|nr:hypothetical protein F5884DRAFT_462928 [Xylogone sp. PMI_703]